MRTLGEGGIPLFDQVLFAHSAISTSPTAPFLPATPSTSHWIFLLFGSLHICLLSLSCHSCSSQSPVLQICPPASLLRLNCLIHLLCSGLASLHPAPDPPVFVTKRSLAEALSSGATTKGKTTSLSSSELVHWGGVTPREQRHRDHVTGDWRLTNSSARFCSLSGNCI